MRIALAIFALTLLPGIPLAGACGHRLRSSVGWLGFAGSLGLLWSSGIALLLTILNLSLNPSSIFAAFIPLLATSAVPFLRRRLTKTLRGLAVNPVEVCVVAATTVALAIPLLTVQRGLPTGDIQKALYWGSIITETRALPDYREAALLNRDPTDFRTPGLHALTAAVMELSGDPFRGPAWFSLTAVVLVAGLAAAIGNLLTPQLPTVTTLAFLFTATNPRFLRYALAPGYHYQNLLGETLLVLAALFLLQALAGRGGRSQVIGALLAAAALPLVHQLTAFLALLASPVLGTVIVWRYRGELASLVANFSTRARRAAMAAGVLAIIAGLVAAQGVTLLPKIHDLFTFTPHLRPYVVPLATVPRLLGIPFAYLSVGGLLIVLVRLVRRELEWRWSLLLLWIAIIFALSQGARYFIDIPSARTLFYLAVPLSLVAAAGVASALETVRRTWPRAAPLLLPVMLALTIAPTAGASLNHGLQNIDHTLQTNATLTPATLEFLAFLNARPPDCAAPYTTCPDAVLVDDWNLRRATWALLSPYRMVTRVGADLAVIAREAKQSAQRQKQYENLLDFEHIFALGNSPEILSLLAHHGIAYVVGAKGLSDDVFAHNAALERVYENGEVVLYAPKSSEFPVEGSRFRERFALANDIGDAEDTFARLPLSLLAPQISVPLEDHGISVRNVESLVSRIGLNVGAYVPERWDADGDRIVDHGVTLTLEVIGNGARGRLTRGTRVFARFALPAHGERTTIRADIPKSELPIDEQGLAFLTLRLDQGPLRVDRLTATLEPARP